MRVYEHKGADAIGANALAATVGAIGTNVVMPGPGIFAWPVWAIGIGIVGATLGKFFDRHGWTHWSFAIGLGAVSTFVVVLAFMAVVFGGQSSGTSVIGGIRIRESGKLTPEGWIFSLTLAVQFAVVGAIAGLTYWKRAYRRTASSS